jgi:hypothetical protein
VLPARFKVVRFSFESLGTSVDAPACEDVVVLGLLQAENGAVVERTRSFLAYSRIMSDPEKFPSLIAQAVRALITDMDIPR